MGDKPVFTPPVSPLIVQNASKVFNVGVLTSGGDSQGMNCAIRAITRETITRGCQCFFIKEGYSGMVDNQIEEANWTSVSNVTNQGGSMIGSSRCEEFRTHDGRKKAALNLFKHRIFHLIVIGGDGTLTGANVLKDEWETITAELLATQEITPEMAKVGRDLRVVGIVGSIDNDMIETDKSIGSDSALKRIVEAVDTLSATASSHQRAFIVEVMGRSCGYLALTAAIALEADYVFYPENPPPDNWGELMCDQLEAMRKLGKRLNIIILSEGAVDAHNKKMEATAIKTEIENRLKYEVRISNLGHLQRGGSPSYLDRLLGLRMGYEAVREVLRTDEYGYQLSGVKNVAKMLCLKGHAIAKQNLLHALSRTRRVAEVSRLGDYDLAAELRGRGFVCKQTFIKLISTPPEEAVTSAMKTFLVVHIGSPCAGMNPTTMAFTRIANHSNIAVLGVEGGWDGLKKRQFVPLTWASVTGWASQAGSKLGTKKQLPTDMDDLAAAIDEKQIEGICIIGGFEAYLSAKIFSEHRTTYQAFNIPIVVVPASISNNIPGTCISLGADTALNEICRQVDNIKQCAIGSRNKAMIIETMGARCGYLAMMSALATGADGALIYQKAHDTPTLKRMAREALLKTAKSGDKYILMRSEGANEEVLAGDVKKIFENELKGDVSCRVNILGYAQQGGTPSCFDRQMGARMGIRAFEGLFAPRKMGRRDCCIVGLRSNAIKFVPVAGLKTKSCNKHRIPLMLWWLDLHPLIGHLTTNPELYESRPSPSKSQIIVAE